MKSKYWKCKSKKASVAKVVVRNNPNWYSWPGLDYYFGDKKDAIQQFNWWYMCDNHKYGMWDCVELYFKENGEWVQQDSEKYWIQRTNTHKMDRIDWSKVNIDI